MATNSTRAYMHLTNCVWVHHICLPVQLMYWFYKHFAMFASLWLIQGETYSLAITENYGIMEKHLESQLSC